MNHIDILVKELKTIVISIDWINRLPYNSLQKYSHENTFKDNLNYRNYIKLLVENALNEYENKENNQIKNTITRLNNLFDFEMIFDNYIKHYESFNKGGFQLAFFQKELLSLFIIPEYDYTPNINNQFFFDLQVCLQVKEVAVISLIDSLSKLYTPEPNQQSKTETNIVPFDYDTTEIKEIFPTDYITAFKEIETRLISENYFNTEGKWIKKKNPLLIAFIKILNEYQYFKIKIKGCKNDKQRMIKFRKFFENRYKVKISHEFQPQNRDKINIKGYFIFITDKR